MMPVGKSRRKTEFGDFQTPIALSRKITAFLLNRGLDPSSVLEPTCGRGNLLLAALDCFPSVTTALGVDINLKYVEQTKRALESRGYFDKAKVVQGNFFDIDWKKILDELPEPIVIIGNPPWVTNSELASMGSINLPQKSNARNLSGLEAITGKSNFDISEWMITHLLDCADGHDISVAMLCKTAVARKVLTHAWAGDIRLGMSPAIHLIDAKKHFNAAVDACLLFCDTVGGESDPICQVYSEISEDSYKTTFGFRDNRLIADVRKYERWKHLEGEEHYRWRSGIKHDCSKVMELRKEEHGYKNGLGEVYALENTYIYPMLKSSEIARKGTSQPARWMLVTQRFVGESTATIAHTAPKTWAYLNDHHELLARRRSSIYKNRPPFSIFGVGEYSFAPWKVAISGLYKELYFAVVGPYIDKPVVLDDTCYFISCQSEDEAQYLAKLLNSELARQFFESSIFWDAKRPVTTEILRRLDLLKLARELRSEHVIRQLLSIQKSAQPSATQLSLL